MAAAEVTVELWTSPRFDWDADEGREDGPNVYAAKILKKAEVGFGSAVNFDMNMYINSGSGVCPTKDRDGEPLSEEAKLQVCQMSCINQMRYCESPPTDGEHTDVTGSMIVSEALTRQCIWNVYHDEEDWDQEQKFYAYMEQFRERGCDTKHFMGRCTQNAWDASGVDPEAMAKCRGVVTNDSDNTVLEEQIQKQSERGIDKLPYLPAILINGKPVEVLSEDTVFQAICATFPKGVIDVCEGSLSGNLGEDENLEDAKEAEEELVSEIAEELGESEEEVEEEVMGLDQNGDFGLTEEEKKTIMEAEEDELEEMEEEEEELGDEAFGVLEEEGYDAAVANDTVPSESVPADGSTEQAETLVVKTPVGFNPELPGEAGSPQVPSEASPLGEGAEAPEDEQETPTPELPSEGSPPDEEAEAPEAEPERPTPEFPSEGPPPAGEVETQEKEGEEKPSIEFPSESSRPEPQFPSESESSRPEVQLPSEISSPELDKVNSNSEQHFQSPNLRTSEPQPEDTMELEFPLETQQGEDELLGLSFVDTALHHMPALKTCHVDTVTLMDKLIALGSSGQLTTEAEDIESDLPLMMTEDCPHEEGVEILHRLRNFNGCAMFDLQALIETFPSTAMGVAMRCAKAYQNMTKEEEEKGFIPYDCIRTIEASSSLGRGLFGLYLYPDVACPCFEKLGDNIPECTADVWPIPINGALLKTQSCLVAQYCKSIDGVCNDKMSVLNTCLPPRGTKPGDMQCEEIFDKCSEVYDDIHPMLNAAPLPDACVRIAQGSDYYGTHIVERYDAFRHRCGENIELWEGHSKVAEFKSFVQEGIYGIDYESVPFVSGAAGGFLAGVIFTIVFIVVRNICIWIKNFICNCCCCGRKNKRPKTKDYATIDTNGEEMEEYRDEEP